METEGTSALKAEDTMTSPENKIIPFPTDRVKKLPTEKIEPFKIPREPDMQTNDFQLWLPKGRSGFTFKTDQALARGPYNLDAATKEEIRKKMAGQMAFTQGTLAKAALDEYRKNPTPENKEKYEAFRVNYLERSTPNIGLRNLRITGDTITVDTRPIEFPVNGVLASLERSDQDNEMGVISSTSGNVIFAPDKFGKKELGVMKRSKKNGNWRDVGGAMIAGYFDGKLNTKTSKESPNQGRRTLESVDNKAILGNAHKELHEETGIEEKDIKKSVISGFVSESRTRPHHEILTDVELKLTVEQAKEKSRQHKVDNEEEFEEDWLTIECSPEAIYTLLTKVMNPFPSSHIAAFAATGRRLVAEKSGEKAAAEYMRKLELGINQHNARINETVRKYLRDNPQVMTQPTASQMEKIQTQVADFVKKNPAASEEEKTKYMQGLIENRTKFDPERFNSALLPQEQGLLDIHAALVEAGLITADGKAIEVSKQQTLAKTA